MFAVKLDDYYLSKWSVLDDENIIIAHTGKLGGSFFSTESKAAEWLQKLQKRIHGRIQKRFNLYIEPVDIDTIPLGNIVYIEY